MLKTILIVDFDRTSIQEFRDNLRNEDFRLITANDGEEATKLFVSNPPDLVLTAALLPKLNGFELCKRITSGSLGEAKPVIMYSAIYKAEKYRKEALAACGALEFLEKPIPKWQLLKVVRSAFNSMLINGSSRSHMNVDPKLKPSSTNHEQTLQRQAMADDLLDVDQLLEVQPTNAVTAAQIQSENILTELPFPETSIETIEESEVEAAVDAFRIDLDDEIRARDARWADESRAQAALVTGEDILEFEGTSGAPVLEQSNAGEFELDGLEIRSVQEEHVAVVPSFDSTTASKSNSNFTPSFSMNSTESRNWRPIIALAALLLFALFCLYWFKII